MSDSEPSLTLYRVGLNRALWTMKVFRDDDDDGAYVNGDVARLVCPALGKRESFRYTGNVTNKVAAKALVGAWLGRDGKDKHLGPMALLLGMEHVLKGLDDRFMVSMESEFNEMYKFAKEQGIDTEPLVQALNGNSRMLKRWDDTTWLPDLRGKLRENATFACSEHVNDVVRALTEDKVELNTFEMMQLLTNFRLDMDVLLSAPDRFSFIQKMQEQAVQEIQEGASGGFSALDGMDLSVDASPDEITNKKNTSPVEISDGKVKVNMFRSSMQISSYVLRRGTGQTTVPVSWTLRASVDGHQWFTIDTQKNNTALERDTSVVIKLRGVTRPVHVVKLKLQENSKGSSMYSLAYFDVFGFLKPGQDK